LQIIIFFADLPVINLKYEWSESIKFLVVFQYSAFVSDMQCSSPLANLKHIAKNRANIFPTVLGQYIFFAHAQTIQRDFLTSETKGFVRPLIYFNDILAIGFAV
jgi:hypothetical protein